MWILVVDSFPLALSSPLCIPQGLSGCIIYVVLNQMAAQILSESPTVWDWWFRFRVERDLWIYMVQYLVFAGQDSPARGL